MNIEHPLVPSHKTILPYFLRTTDRLDEPTRITHKVEGRTHFVTIEKHRFGTPKEVINIEAEYKQSDNPTQEIVFEIIHIGAKIHDLAANIDYVYHLYKDHSPQIDVIDFNTFETTQYTQYDCLVDQDGKWLLFKQYSPTQETTNTTVIEKLNQFSELFSTIFQ